MMERQEIKRDGEVGLRFIRLKEVCQLVGYSRAAVYRHMRADKFPRPYDLGGGRAVGWLESEVQNWICTRIEARRNEVRGANLTSLYEGE
jgi:prophage regulatory protein